MLSGLPLWLLLAIFVVAAAVVWFAGIQLSKTTDVLDSRLHIGSALGGLIVLAIATNLPEVAITVSAAISGDVSVAVGNILGGIAIQTVVIVILDAFGKRGKGVNPLTNRVASLVLMLEAVVVVGVLVVAVAGSQLPPIVILHLTPGVVAIAAVWVVGLFLVKRAGKGLPWDEDGDAPGPSQHESGHQRNKSQSSQHQWSTGRVWLVFSGAALATLVAGAALEQSGEAASSQVGLSGLLFGATVLALATSLPDISTGLQSVRQGDDDLAVSDIFGANAFLPVLFLVAALISGKAILPKANAGDIYLTAIGALLTLIYVVGLVFRPKRRVLGMGVDSLTVLVVYLVGVGGLFAIAGG